MDLFDEIKRIGKRPVIAQIGGFRPEEGLKSWFGGNFVLKKDMNWPGDDDGLMVPVIQIVVDEVPNGKDSFGDTKLIQVYLNTKELPSTPAKNGDGWRLLEYKSNDDMAVVETPKESQIHKPFQIKWILSEKPDFPCWEESWDYFDMTEINESEELSERFFDEFERYYRTKIGGYASYIQSLCGDYEYVFQISSEEKPGFMVGDNGNIYILKSKTDNQWFLHWDCY